MTSLEYNNNYLNSLQYIWGCTVGGVDVPYIIWIVLAYNTVRRFRSWFCIRVTSFDRLLTPFICWLHHVICTRFRPYSISDTQEMLFSTSLEVSNINLVSLMWRDFQQKGRTTLFSLGSNDSIVSRSAVSTCPRLTPRLHYITPFYASCIVMWGLC